MDWLWNLPATLLVDAIGALDELPDYARAALAAGLLVVFLRLFESKIGQLDIAYGEAYRKTALLTLLLLPALLVGFPEGRLAVLVETLPTEANDSHPVWLTLLGLWAVGCTVALARLGVIRYRRLTWEQTLVPLEDERLEGRLRHWQRRLGIRQRLRLVALGGATPCYLARRQLVGFPVAAQHWPVNVQDVIIIRALCHKKLHHGRWHLLAQLVAAGYWPVPWVARMHDRLIANFQLAADRLSTSCYQDHIGFDRAWRQLAQRLEGSRPSPARAPKADVAGPAAAGRLARVSAALERYRHAVARLWSPSAEIRWSQDLQASATTELVWTDPYDRVFLFVGQAVVLAFLLTGMTLEEIREKPEPDFSLWFEIDWSRDFHRNLERFEPQKLPSAPDDAGN